MTRLIYADEAIKRITAEYNKREAYKTGGLKLAWIEQAISGTPTVDAVPVRQVRHGRWTCVSIDRYVCSVCGCEPWYGGSIRTLNYCPYCGARMDEEREEQ